MNAGVSSRRTFFTLVGAAAAWPLAAHAQRMRRIGVLVGGDGSDPEIQERMEALRLGLQPLGWTVGRNIEFDIRYAVGNANQARRYAADLVALNPDVLVASSSQSLVRLMEQTRTLPIVFVAAIDPVSHGFAESLARPGGMVTGFNYFEPSLTGKLLGLLKEIAPQVVRVGFPYSTPTVTGADNLRSLQTVAPSFGVEAVGIPLSNPDDIDASFERFAQAPGGALLSLPDIFIGTHRARVILSANRLRLPTAFFQRKMVKLGALVSYGIEQAELHSQVATYVDRILRGAKPSDLPVQAPTHFDTVVNLKTAKALGLTVPPMLLGRADEVIE